LDGVVTSKGTEKKRFCYYLETPILPSIYNTNTVLIGYGDPHVETRLSPMKTFTLTSQHPNYALDELFDFEGALFLLHLRVHHAPRNPSARRGKIPSIPPDRSGTPKICEILLFSLVFYIFLNITPCMIKKKPPTTDA
jgi:hypothetical protein